MRADAEANRKRLLDTAELLFAERGTDVSVADIVAAAGVGPPTLYRHFGAKDGLIRAVEERRWQTGASHMARALAAPTGWEGLRLAIESSIELARESLAVREPRGLSLPASLEQVLLSGWTELIQRGQREGSIRTDIAATDVPYIFAAAGAAARAAHYRRPLQDRYVMILMEGLRADGGAPLPGRPPSRRDVHDAFSRGSPGAREASAGRG
jgi:AcrR family transcriptional regulator